MSETELFIIKSVQYEMYGEEIECIQNKMSIPRQSPIARINPFLDERQMLRVGGRITKSKLSLTEKKPLLVPGRHHIATLIIRYHHSRVQHQGRHFTDGAIRAAGLSITGGKRLISSILYKCVICRRLRGKT